MCFSATANFAGSVVLGTLGAFTLTRVRHRRELLFASVPLLFAVHQFVEGFVWLGIDGVLPQSAVKIAGSAFMLYAQGFLPFLLPLAILLFEGSAPARRRMLPFVILGGGLSLYTLWALTAYSVQVSERGHSIVYANPATHNPIVAVLYVIATCGSLFFSKVRAMVLFGIANLTILFIVFAVKKYAFTSIWCAYAAIASIIILVYFWRTQANRPFTYAESV